jgi:hypothetical protein
VEGLASTTAERERPPSGAECVAVVHCRGASPAWPQQRPPAVGGTGRERAPVLLATAPLRTERRERGERGEREGPPSCRGGRRHRRKGSGRHRRALSRRHGHGSDREWGESELGFPIGSHSGPFCPSEGGAGPSDSIRRPAALGAGASRPRAAKDWAGPASGR